jgi:hypothetical protein
MSLDNLRELTQHPGWVDYLDLIEENSIILFGQIVQLDPTKPDSYVKFLEFKAKLDGLRDMTYLIERRVKDQKEIVDIDARYFGRLVSMFKKLWRE